MIKLTDKPARKLTDRECAKILGGTIGCLCQMADVEDVRNAIKWQAESEEMWKAMKALNLINKG